ncbi:nSTAND1 domain-containing NTPase [Lyngbya aestuarii]|uniref:nSTAND1 domain-containing NTPase n=1 Tax=Lyngbya aestuarii TaxID=118322 RepID=UPI00403D7FDA
MTNLHQPEDVAAYNENSLQTLVRAIKLSQGKFCLILARCNYAALRDRTLQRLRKVCIVEIRELVLPESVKTLYTTIQAELADEQPQALMVLGLESVSDLDTVLTSTNRVREEFEKNLRFPLVLWINDHILQKLLRLAPDFENWATSVEFAIATEELTYELIYSLRQKAERIFSQFLNCDAGKFMQELKLTISLEDSTAIESALQNLQSRGVKLEPELEAYVQFVQGRIAYASERIEVALVHYQQSLASWQQSNNLEWECFVIFHISLCHDSKADRIHSFIDIVESLQNPELANKFISKLGGILQYQGDWKNLQVLAQRSLKLHPTSDSPRSIAQDYGWLVEVALSESNWERANKLAQRALQTITQTTENQPQDQNLCSFLLFLLAQSQRQLGQFTEAIYSLEKARQESDHHHNPRLYIRILEELRSLHFEQGEYLKVFQIKQDKSSIEQRYGFRAFIGASRLQPQRQTIKTFTQVETQDIVAKEIAVSGRQQDVERLIRERISRDDHKLTVIYGPSGVGKSSILEAGLVPILQQKNIGARDALPVILRVYTNWVENLGKSLADALDKIGRVNLSTALNSLELITEQLQINANSNLLTILIFDQFEEFFFNCPKPEQRKKFWDFLHICLDSSELPYVKVIISLREDYLHYLLECDRLNILEITNNDFLNKEFRYSFGNLPPEDAEQLIQSLTERSFYLEPALIKELVRDLAVDLGEVRPIELQVVGSQLQTDNIKTLEQYRQGGSVEKLAERFLEGVVRDCGPENEQSALLILYLLTDENNNRPLKTSAELARESGIESAKLNLILEILEKSGLVFLLPEFPVNRYQLIHDYLVDFIRQKQQIYLE